MFLRNRRWLVLLFVLVAGVVGILNSPKLVIAQDAFKAFSNDMRFLRDNSEAVLFFNVFGENPDFIKHSLNEKQLIELCAGPCEKFGANAANYFGNNIERSSSEEVEFEWFLQIAQQANPGAVSATINEFAGRMTVIVRFGVAGDSGGFTTPQSLISFLNTVADGTNQEFFAIGGPNEPDLESWAYDDPSMIALYPDTHGVLDRPAGQCGTYTQGSNAWVECVAPRLKEFMVQMCTAKRTGALRVSKVKLLTPAFNVTSPSFRPLIDALTANGTPFDCFDGMAVNLYPAGKSAEAWWYEKGLDNIDIPIYVTETGPYDTIFHKPDNGDDPDGKRDLDVGDEDPTNTTSSVNHYISPILGLWPPAARSVPVIRESLVNQGYQAYCATPTYTIEPEFGGDIEDFIANVRAGFLSGRSVQVDSQEVVNYNNASTPVFRDFERKYKTKADLEDFFGYRELGQDEYARTEIRSGAVNSLLSEKQKCVQTVNMLYAQEEMCNKLIFEPDKNCALFTHVVPGTDYNILQLLQEYKGFSDQEKRVEACSQIVAQPGGKSNKFRYAMVNAPLYITKAYRIAYLVGVIEQKKVQRSALFNFFSHSQEAQPRDEVVVLSFKIPDIGTNKGSTWETETVTSPDGTTLYDQVKRNEKGVRTEKVESGHTYWDDVMTLTRNVLIPRKAAEKMDIEGTEEREKLKAAAESATGQGGSSLVYCLNGQAPFGQGSAVCNNEDVKAVTDVINGTWMYDKERISCDKLSSENADTIGDPARLGPPSFANEFKPKYGEKILANLWGVNSTAQPFQTVFQVYGDTWPPKDCNVGAQGEGSTGDCTTLTFYLVYPMGYDLETLEYVMARTFLTEDQFKYYENNPDIKERFNVFDDIRQLNAEKNEEQFVDCLHAEVDEHGVRYCPEKEFTASLDSDQGPALFFGARLGFWTHEMQKSFNRLESLAHKYLRNCRNTEEFLLDQCGGVASDEEFDAKEYCENNPSKAKIVRDVTEEDLDRFKFYSKYGGPKGDAALVNRSIPDEENTFFPKVGEASCQLNLSVRAVDGLTLILSGGKDIVPSNPGNILGCRGTFSASKKIKIKRLPPEFGRKPEATDKAWIEAETLVTSGNSASEVQSAISLRPGYYLIDVNIDNKICQSDHTWVMQDGKEIGEDGYVIDFVNEESCKAQACIDANLQSNMEGGGPVFGKDEEGNEIVLYTIDKANEYHKDSFGCELSFEYSTIKYNNSCGGGRALSCMDPELGANCGFWSDLIDDIRNSSDEIMKKGRDAYRAVYGRLPNASGDMSCTNKANGDPIFGHTLVIRSCETYTNALDSLRVFQKIVGFRINWFSPSDQREKEFAIPSQEVWDAVKKASERHGCDPWLLLGLASSEGEDHTYRNDTIQDDQLRLGIFQITKPVWDRWIKPNDPAANQCSQYQPKSFNESIVAGKLASDIPAAFDTACRMLLHTGVQKYPDNKESFVKAFVGNVSENGTGEGWSKNPNQAEYVWEFWQKARGSAEEPAKPQPADYPTLQCGGVDTPPPGGPGNPPSTGTNTGTPPTAEQENSWTTQQWKDFFHYNQPSVLPHVGTVTYQGLGVIDTVLFNRQNGRTTYIPELSTATIRTCTLDYSQGSTPQEVLQSLQAQAQSNGASKAIGCAASVRIGDMLFSPTGPDQGPNAFRTFWIKPKNGVFKDTAIGPILVMDVADQNHLRQQYLDHGGDYVGDIGQPLFQFIHSGYGAWNGPQDVMVCDTKEQCERTPF